MSTAPIFAVKATSVKSGALKSMSAFAALSGHGDITANNVIEYVAIKQTELAALQAAAQKLLDYVCVIERRTRAQDGWLGTSDTWGAIATTVVGLSRPTLAQLQQYADLIGAKTSWIVKLPINTDVIPQDHLVIASQTMIVQLVMMPRSFATLKTVLVTEVKGNA